MAYMAHGVIARAKQAPVEVAEIVVPDPGFGEVLVRVQASGVCETDLNHRDGKVGGGFPFLLGHEGAGVVEAVGDGVTDVVPGDFVILHWRAVCGACRACRRGKPTDCLSPLTAGRPTTLADGTPLTPVLGLGTLADKVLVHQRQCIRTDPGTAPVTTALLGCGVTTGVGAALHTGGVQRGDSVVVIGCDTIGCAAVAGARLGGATIIIAADDDPRKLGWAEHFGATHTLENTVDLVPRVRELTDGFGADVVLDAMGGLDTWKQALRVRAQAGMLVMLGLPAPELILDIALVELRAPGGSLASAWYGDSLPTRDIPALAALHRQGQLDLDAFVTETIALTQVEKALEKLRHREVLRSVVILEPAG
ncbi:alcohol dehydrogenase catalytic domain-containing protein [Nocardia huaxiensis]|uniref:alcohol dehydrogenase catalytic domain-containing protein n=1 Tax=Nocardia huaxiensis TaxID=2755382 RepID=UPI001E631FEA|nr:alcohol dehydrogenase catalytic domain-containing protein [Nocardia huaxiensis]UFS93575.1 alcohol dehydrogenase catalytic domain-containing protein [Nocardia huaxiensis]